MSWAEIKKAVNSNLDVPLNVQLGSGRLTYRGGRYAGSGYAFRLANSKGRVYCCMVSNPYTYAGTYVSIDGQKIMGDIGMGSTQVVGVLPIDFITGNSIVSGNNGAIMLVEPNNTGGTMATSHLGTINGYPVSKENPAQSVSSNCANFIGDIILEPILFHDSVEIYVPGGSSSPCTYMVLYELLD